LIKDFGNKAAYDLFTNGQAKSLPRDFWKRTVFLLDLMEAVDSLEVLSSKGFPPNLRLHNLKGDRKGEYAIDINKISGWRITFRFEKKEFCNVKVENYH